MASNRVKCFFDVKIDDDDAGRIIVDLFNDVCPKTCENFRALCTGEMGESEKSGKPLHYKNVKFHRVIKGFMVQSGDFTNNNGSGGESIYGGKFEDENFDVKHDEKYMLSMANKGENTNGSQFFITTEVCPHLDGRHVAFGKVVKGFEVVNAIENLPVDNRSRPLAPAVIVNCGELRLQKSSSSKTKGEKKKKLVSESDSSNSEDEKRLKRKEKKAKKKKDKESEEEGQQSANEEQLHPFASVSKINPDEIPDVPKNRFLDRGGNYDPPVQRNNDLQEEEPSGRLRSKASVQIYTRSGRKVKGRGFLRYRTPSRSRSRSMTPPHWKQAQGRHMKMDQLQEYRKRIDKQAREFDRRHKRRKERLEQEESSNLLIKQLGRVHSAISSSVLQVNPMEKINENIEGDWRVSRKQTLKKLKDERKKEKKSKHKDSSRSDPSNGDLKKKKKKERRGELELDDSALDYEADDGSESVTTNGTNHNKNRDSDNRRARSSSRDRKRDRRRSRSNSRRRSRSRDRARNRRRSRSRSRSKDRSRGWKNDRRRRSRSRS